MIYLCTSAESEAALNQPGFDGHIKPGERGSQVTIEVLPKVGELRRHPLLGRPRDAIAQQSQALLIFASMWLRSSIALRTSSAL